jgi:hypothetical protein
MMLRPTYQEIVYTAAVAFTLCGAIVALLLMALR